ncbi:MAG: apolipoprotein N-acyltransferase [Parcubacteria group bacterium Greene1014_15]|nr:MAG: apolipoprotein N-acyltransferase [Parcubacteria group bacterium Greene1014_15]
MERTQKHLILPIVSGLLLALTVPSFDAGFLVWFALVPLLWYITCTSGMWKVFGGGLITGTIYGIKVLYPLTSLNAWWWANPEAGLFAFRTHIFSIILVFIALYSGGVFIGLFSILYKKYGTGKIADMFIFAFIWALFEFIREPLVLGFTWGHLGYALHNNTIVAQIASLGLVYSLSFLIVAINVGVFQILRSAWISEIPPSLPFTKGGVHIPPSLPFTKGGVHIKRMVRFASPFFKGGLRGIFRDPNEKHEYIPLFHTITRNSALYCSIFLVASVVLFGSIRLSSKQSGQTVRIAAIHMDITTEESHSIDAYNSYITLIDEAVVHHPDIVVLPENAFPFFVIDQKTYLPLKYENSSSNVPKLFDSLVKRSKDNPETAFAIGMHSMDVNEIHNSIIVLENGVISDMYNKRRLMPLAEDDTKLLRSELTKTFSEGSPHQTLTAHAVRITPLICSEIIFPSLSRDKTSDIIVNASNDSVFQSALVGEQNHIIAKIRAIENRKPLIRSVKGGISSIIDQHGVTLAQAREKRTVIFADVIY